MHQKSNRQYYTQICSYTQIRKLIKLATDGFIGVQAKDPSSVPAASAAAVAHHRPIAAAGLLSVGPSPAAAPAGATAAGGDAAAEEYEDERHRGRGGERDGQRRARPLRRRGRPVPEPRGELRERGGEVAEQLVEPLPHGVPREERPVAALAAAHHGGGRDERLLRSGQWRGELSRRRHGSPAACTWRPGRCCCVRLCSNGDHRKKGDILKCW
jgi:hypothetical protein